MRDVRKMAEIWPMAEAALAAGGCFRLWPSGRSMRPTLREGQDSVLLIRPEDIRPLDILLVRAPDGSFILHRAIRIGADGVTLCGDAHTEPEGPFPREAVLARVARIYKEEQERDPRAPRALAAARLSLFCRRLKRTVKRLLWR